MTETYVGLPLFSESGERVGVITDVILRPSDMEPEWVTVKPGMLHREHLVPVVTIDKRSDVLVTNVDAGLIKHAPAVRSHVRPTSVERRSLIAHYGMASGADDAPEVPGGA